MSPTHLKLLAMKPNRLSSAIWPCLSAGLT